MRSRRLERWVLAPIAILASSAAIGGSVTGADPVPGSQGTDTSLPLTDSAVTITGRDDFESLEITVNQTADLTNQAVSITWTGGTPTRQGPGRFAANYLQIMQCWGDDDGTVPGNPGPPPEQCVQGAVAGTYGGLPGSLYPSGFALTRVISRTSWENHDESVGVADPRTSNVWRPFRAVDGTEVGVHTDPDFNPAVSGGNFWLNSYFDVVTTNEIAGGVTRPNGTGAELMELYTGVQSSGLGCGQRVLRVGDERTMPKCWIVIVPRSTPEVENVGTPFESNAAQQGVATSPLSPAAWQHRIAIPLEFTPVDSPCRLGDDERQISGNELLFPAISSWQPLLCADGKLPPFSYAPVGDPVARQQLVAGRPGGPGLVAISSPVEPSSVAEDAPVVYAPLAASGIVVGFNIERVPRPTAPLTEQELAGVRVAEMNLTPRLVTKLLTQSYSLAVQIVEAPDYEWRASNPSHLGLDPDFLQFNPEFQLLGNGNRNLSALTVPTGNTDAAAQVWEWILSDPEAAAWMAGEPDEWGMQVNPVFSTDAKTNTMGFAFGDPAPVSFPKADPYCYASPPIGPRADIVPPPLCGTDWLPYARNFEQSAQITRAASDLARVVLNPFAISSSDAWSKVEPQFLGSRTIASVTDAVSAARYGLQAASLSRAGDNGPSRTFVAPDAVSMTAGLRSMAERDVDGVVEPAPLAQPADAYPLTTLTYGAVTPLSLDADARSDYAAFIRYAVGDGQRPGVAQGELPPGYVPLTEELIDAAHAAAGFVETLTAPPPPTTTSTTVPVTTAVPVATSPAATTPVVPPAGPPSARPVSPQRPGTQSRDDEVDATSTTEVATTTTVSPAPSTTTDVDESTGVATPSQPAQVTRYAVPALGGMALASALAALELTKRPRRLSDDGGAEPSEEE